MRTRSFVGILNLRLRHHFFPKIAAQIFRRAQIDLAAAENARQLLFHVIKLEEPDSAAGLEFDQHINIAIRTEIRTQDGTEKCQLADSVATAEEFQAVLRNWELNLHVQHCTLHKGVGKRPGRGKRVRCSKPGIRSNTVCLSVPTL